MLRLSFGRFPLSSCRRGIAAASLSFLMASVFSLASLHAEKSPDYSTPSRSADEIDETVHHYESTPSDDGIDVSHFNKDEDRVPWTFILAVNGGYNQLLKGYKGYSDLGNAGVDIYMKPGRARLETPGWKEHLMFRLSADYFPLQVPKGVYGLTEDLYGVYGDILVKAFSFSRPEQDQWVPFLGFGVGHYFDRVTLDTPASGKISGTHNHFGGNATLGVMTPSFWGRFYLIPEVRFHALKIPDNSWSMNMTYQAGLGFQF